MRFLGCKESLLPFIDAFLEEKGVGEGVFFDFFAGTGAVGKRFKARGFSVISCDILEFCALLQRVYIRLNIYPSFRGLQERLRLPMGMDNRARAECVIEFLNHLPGRHGYITENFSDAGSAGRKFFRKVNAERVDSIREKIEIWSREGMLTQSERALLLCALVEAVPFVANISGTYAAYLKEWDKRSLKPLTLKTPALIPSKHKHRVYCTDALSLLDTMEKVDVLYLDPPYNERQYGSNYHVLETITRWKKPAVTGITGVRGFDVPKSAFCNAASALNALDRIAGSAKYKHLILSYNDDGIMPEEKIIEILGRYGRVEVAQQSYRRFKSHGKTTRRTPLREKLYYVKASIKE